MISDEFDWILRVHPLFFWGESEPYPCPKAVQKLFTLPETKSNKNPEKQWQEKMKPYISAYFQSKLAVSFREEKEDVFFP